MIYYKIGNSVVDGIYVLLGALLCNIIITFGTYTFFHKSLMFKD